MVVSFIQLPSYTLGWKQMWPYTISGIPQVMQRERFERLCKYFHCNVRPVLDAVSKTCLDNYKPPKEQTIDEGMIAFKGTPFFQAVPTC